MKRLQTNKKAIQSLIAVLVLTLTSASFAESESYQMYLDRINNTVRTIQPVTVFIPTTQTQNQQTNTQNYQTQHYNGFSSYEAYLNNYYATVGNARTVMPSDLEPVQTTTCLTVSDILKINIEGQYLACDGTLYTLTRNESVATTPARFLLDYSINYQEIAPEVVTPEATVFTPVYVYPEVEARTQVVEPVPAVGFNTVQALEFEVGNSYTFDNGLKLTVLEITDNRCFAGQYCARAGEVVARFNVDFRDQRNLLTVTMEPGEEPEVNFLLANTSIKFTGIKYSQVNGQALLQSVVQTR